VALPFTKTILSSLLHFLWKEQLPVWLSLFDNIASFRIVGIRGTHHAQPTTGHRFSKSNHHDRVSSRRA